MVAQVLSFARGQEGKRTEIAPGDLVADVVRIARDTLPKNIEIVTDVSAELPPIFGDPTQCHQVLLNLCVNARDAMPNGGTLTLSAEAVDDRLHRRTIARRTWRAGDYVVIPRQGHRHRHARSSCSTRSSIRSSPRRKPARAPASASRRR